MQPVREHYLAIPASGPLPLKVKAEVLDTAHAFTDDGELFERLVAIEEERIRQLSDKSHERVRRAREAEARKEQEKQARAARAAADDARQERINGMTPRRPWDVDIKVPLPSQPFNAGRLVDSIANQYEYERPQIRIPGMPEPPKPPEPLTDQQIEAKVAQYRTDLKSRWQLCRDYLGGLAWPALRFRIQNEVKSALTDVEVILTFHGARGVEFKEMDDFELEKVADPNWEPPTNYVLASAAVPPPLFRSTNYPIKWRHNDAGDLEVTAKLPRLRPHPQWRSYDHGEDIVLVVDPGVDLHEVKVTYTATSNDPARYSRARQPPVPVKRMRC